MRTMIRLSLASVCIVRKLLMNGQRYSTGSLEEQGLFLLALAFDSFSL